MVSRSHAITALAVALALASTVVAVSAVTNAASNAQPADKMAVSGATIEVSGPGVQVPILTGTMKTSSPTDIVVTVSLECDILTNVTTTGDGSSSAMGRVKVWVELDGKPISVNSAENGDDAGKVTFCDRTHQQTTQGFNNPIEQDNTINSFLQTRTANSFQWVSLNLGSGDHTFVVKSTLTETGTNKGVAQAAIGKRTLTVEPVKLANNAVI